MKQRNWIIAAAAGVSLGAACVQAQVPAAAPTPQQQAQQMLEFYKAHYVKHEFHIATRDGVKLYAQVYTPIAGKFED